MVDYKLDELCSKTEMIRMYYKSPITEIILGPPRYPSRNLKKVEKIFDPVLETMKKDLNKTLSPKKIERIRKEISKAKQIKADYQRRIVLWYELGNATFDSERRFITGYTDENQSKYNELHKLEGIYSDYNKGQGFTYLEKIRLKLRLYPTEEQIVARLACKPEPRIKLEEHLALIMEQKFVAKAQAESGRSEGKNRVTKVSDEPERS